MPSPTPTSTSTMCVRVGFNFRGAPSGFIERLHASSELLLQTYFAIRYAVHECTQQHTAYLSIVDARAQAKEKGCGTTFETRARCSVRHMRTHRVGARIQTNVREYQLYIYVCKMDPYVRLCARNITGMRITKAEPAAACRNAGNPIQA